MMKEQIKYLWIDALTSGNYKKTVNRLKHYNTFCCLGVLCDLYHKDTGLGGWKHTEEGDGQMKFLNQEYALPKAVRDWAGLGKKASGEYIADDHDKRSLSADNDSGERFKNIAKIIEEHF